MPIGFTGIPTLALGMATAQNVASRTDVYHVHFTAAVPGKAAQLGQINRNLYSSTRQMHGDQRMEALPI